MRVEGADRDRNPRLKPQLLGPKRRERPGNMIGSGVLAVQFVAALLSIKDPLSLKSFLGEAAQLWIP